MTERDRETMLEEVARGLRSLAELEEKRSRQDGTMREEKLWRVELALLDEKGKALAVGPVTSALSWIVDRMHQTEETLDISGAVSAHVQVFEGCCVERACAGRTHRVEDEEDDR